jgi:RNA polymerase sigma factor FliA
MNIADSQNNEDVRTTSSHAEILLWNSARDGDSIARARLIESYLHYARIIAAKLYSGRIDSDLEFTEYLQFATVGLIEAIDRFDPTKDVQFKTFAGFRIHGAVMSGIEHLSEKRVQIATQARLRAERLNSGITEPQQPSNDIFHQLAEVAMSLAIGYMLDDTNEEEQVAYSELSDNAYVGIELRQLKDKIRSLVERLPQRERTVIKCHYLNQMPFHLIADSMGLSKGRVSQIHHQALKLLRDAAKSVKACDIAW